MLCSPALPQTSRLISSASGCWFEEPVCWPVTFISFCPTYPTWVTFIQQDLQNKKQKRSRTMTSWGVDTRWVCLLPVSFCDRRTEETLFSCLPLKSDCTFMQVQLVFCNNPVSVKLGMDISDYDRYQCACQKEPKSARVCTERVFGSGSGAGPLEQRREMEAGW